jgi:hypothetical protein
VKSAVLYIGHDVRSAHLDEVQKQQDAQVDNVGILVQHLFCETSYIEGSVYSLFSSWENLITFTF